MHPLLSGYRRAVETVCIAGICIVAILGGLQVWFRYVSGNSLVWSEEVMRLSMIWTVMLGSGLAYSRGQFLGMQFLVEALPQPLARACNLLSALLVVGFLAAIAWFGWKFAWKTRLQLSSTLGYSLIWLHVSIVVGSILMAAHVLAEAIWGRRPLLAEEAIR
ncbi:TRAP transporter small permease [Frigidibacter oleivorans]|uniref:TRAP transporter small permease n=1 Tax=Frigidibacter oleivorans TaxID=2487129 RepID=UPI0013DFE33D|nr:TRAP transporter small permease [Frigidibacter oleivorans]